MDAWSKGVCAGHSRLLIKGPRLRTKTLAFLSHTVVMDVSRLGVFRVL